METSQTWIANVAILNKLLAKESWFNTFWAKFSGNVDISNDDNGNPVYRPSGKPIEILSDYIAQGRDNMLIPFLSDLSGSPVFGDTVLKGTGEDQTMKWLRSFVNQYRKAVMKRSGQMSEQRQKLYKLYDQARPQMARWFTKWENQAIFQTFYDGVSPNLSEGTNSDGLGVSKRYHPNWYGHTADGVLSAVGTEKALTLNGDLDTAVGMTAATAGTADTTISAKMLRALRIKMMELKIPQIVTKDGYKYWALVIHPVQHMALLADSDYLNAYRYGNMGKGAGKMPEVNGMSGYYSGFCIFEDIIGIREWDEAGYFFGATTSARFDPTAVTLHADASSKRIYNAIAFGNGALGKGVAQNLHFTNEVDDHANTIEVGGAMINGYNRADFVAENKAGDSSGYADGQVFSKGNAAVSEYNTANPAVNQSSLIVATAETP